MATYRKARRGAPRGFFRCEAAGLRWLAEADAVPVVAVRDVGDDHLDLDALTPVAPSRPAATAFGSALARMHGAGASSFGAGPPGWAGDGFFGPLSDPLPMPAGDFERWGEFLATCRIEPVARELSGRGIDVPGLGRLSSALRAGRYDDDEPPARLHGDLWSGNVMWTPAGVTLIDPAAHGGHRETDLAMLALFGLPFLDDVLRAYDESAPLRRGWRRRVALHQVYPVGVHAVLFGGSYIRQLTDLLDRLVPTSRG